MERVYGLPFLVLEVPNLKIKRPSWFQQPSAMVMFALVLLSYFFVTGGKLMVWMKTMQSILMITKYQRLPKNYFECKDLA